MDINRVNQSANGATLTNSNIIMVGGDVKNLEDLLKHINNAQSSNNSVLLNQLIEDSLKYIEENINDGFILKSDKLISKILLCTLDGVNEENKIKLYYYKGIVNINHNKDEEVKICVENIRDINEKSLFLYKLKVKSAIYRKDEETYNGLIKDFSQYTINEIDVERLKMEYLALNERYSEIIEKSATIANDDEKISYYLAIAYLNSDMFDKALIYANKALEKNNRLKYILIREQSITFEIIYNIKKTGYVTAENLNKFKESYNRLEDLNEQIEDLTENMQVSFYCTKLNILLYSKDKSLEDFYASIPHKLKDSYNIKNIFAMFYNEEGRHREAIKIYDELNNISESVYNYMCIFEGLLQINEYKEIISRFDKLEKESYDSEGVIVSIYLVALINEGQSVDEKLAEYDEIYIGKPLYYTHIIQGFSDINIKRKYFSLLKNNLGSCSILFTFRAIQIAREMELIDDEVEILEKSQSNLPEINKMLLEAYLKINNKESLIKAKILVDNELEKNKDDFNLYLIKSKVEHGLQNWRESLRYYKLAFEIDKDEFIASNIVLLMLQLEEYEDLETYCSYITSKCSRSDLLMISAMGYDVLGMTRTADELSFQAMYLQGNINNDILMQQCIGIQMGRIRRTTADNITEFDCIGEECVCILSNKQNGELINICINSQEKYNSNEDKVFNAKHISMDNEYALELIGLRVNDEVELDNKEYIVREIIDKYVYMFRYYLNLYTKLNPKSRFVRTIDISTPEKFAEDVKSIENEFSGSKEVVSLYRFDNENIGIPLDMLTRGELVQYNQVIKILLSNNQQVLYAGERNRDINLNSFETIVLSLSTIVILYELGQLYLLDRIRERIIIPKSLEQKIFNCYKNSIIMKQRGGGRVLVDDYNRVNFFDYKSIDTDKIWKDIYNCVKKLKKEDTSSFKLNNTMANLLKICGVFQIDSILLAEKYNGILLCDDLFLRRISTAINVTNSNVLSLLDVLTVDESSKLLLEISNKSYCSSSLPFDILGSKIPNEDKNKAMLNLYNNDIKKSIYGSIIDYIRLCFTEYERVDFKVNILE